MSDPQPRSSARPRVLLADDHPTFLEWVSRFLAGAFDIVGQASNGRQALDLTRRLRPDVAVLDVGMPELDGFQTLEHLRRESPETKVVFLTMHREDEFIAAAINGGAHGYVVKSHIASDLISAIEHALAGRQYVPRLSSLSTVPGGRHAIHIDGEGSHFLDDVSEVAARILRSGEQIVVVTDEATRAGLARRLQARHIDLRELAARGRYIAQDSTRVLSAVMHDGRPDEKRLGDIIQSLDRLRLDAPGGPGSRLTVIGDIAVSLCRNGELEAALEVERIWNELTRPLPFFTICNYPAECFENPAGRSQVARLHAEHTAVIA